MKYINAIEVLPKELISEIQKYIEGNVLYIPNKPGKRMGWGEKTGTKNKCRQRNNEIRSLYKSGKSLDELSKKYYLAIETIKKIIYSS
ncbi:CD3324 family protein [uncultured Clostridium sp.]|uniref:CD3324 family protein n=1 Tax=uncultured Clostridium sp. TaxID=59620 RepID=UPI0025DBEE21|nr:CD3324 family protein [uncultured Clostridium sp.]